MHVLYIHQNFPAQFGHIAQHLVQNLKWRCSFVSQTPPGNIAGIEKIQYKLTGGATRNNHFCSRTFENNVWHCDAVYQALKARPDVKPDLIVGHSGLGGTLFLRELYPNVPLVNFFEYYYRPHHPDSDMDFRKDLGWKIDPAKYNRARCRNAMILLDLQNCNAAYTPTQFQKSCFPKEYWQALRVIFDGIDRSLFHGYQETLRPPPAARTQRTIAGISVPASTRVVTYVGRGFESMRGFDIFMRSAKLIAKMYPDVLFLVVGSDKIVYGGDEAHLEGKKTFKEWVLSREEFDLSKFAFVGQLPPVELGRVLAASDLHMYFTVPFVLSWSVMDALSCGATVLASGTPPVKEMIRDGTNGILADFFDIEQIATKAVAVLKDPGTFRPLGRNAEQIIARHFSLPAVLPRMLKLYEDAFRSRPAAAAKPKSPAVLTAVQARTRSPFNG